jgi:histone-lysine N-methyltransferase SETMAR
VEATSEEMCQKMEILILVDTRMKVSRLAEETEISVGAVWTIIHEKLDMSRVSARWVPRMLSPFQKDTRRQCCQENLELLTEDPEIFFRLVTGDETWVYHRYPESKMESMQWKHKTSPALKQAVTTWFAEQSKDFFFPWG